MSQLSGPKLLSAAEGQRPRNYLSCCCSCLLCHLHNVLTTPTTQPPPRPPRFQRQIVVHFKFVKCWSSFLLSSITHSLTLSLSLSTHLILFGISWLNFCSKVARDWRKDWQEHYYFRLNTLLIVRGMFYIFAIRVSSFQSTDIFNQSLSR